MLVVAETMRIPFTLRIYIYVHNILNKHHINGHVIVASACGNIIAVLHEIGGINAAQLHSAVPI
jgi:hypothetical protein